MGQFCLVVELAMGGYNEWCMSRRVFTYKTTLSESVTEILLREEITHSTGMTMNGLDTFIALQSCIRLKAKHINY